MAEEPLRFEQLLERLTTIVDNLERGDLPLEESLTQFEEGVRLSRDGAALLDGAERKIEQLLKGAEGDRVVPFTPGAAPATPSQGGHKDDDLPF